MWASMWGERGVEREVNINTLLTSAMELGGRGTPSTFCRQNEEVFEKLLLEKDDNVMIMIIMFNVYELCDC